MKRFLFYIFLLVPMAAFAQSSLKRTAPEDEGVKSADIAEFLDAMMKHPEANTHGVMVLRHGHVIAEAWKAPFKASYGHALYSVSKTFTAVAVGLCVQDSLLTLQDNVYKRLMDSEPQDSAYNKLNVGHLLTMQSGLPVQYVSLRKDSARWTRALLSQQMVAEPGTLFAYDSMNSYLLSALVQKVTGKRMLDLLKERIFSPLGIANAAWEQSPEGVNCGGWGLYLKLEDMAKFGQLLLNKGKWGSAQLVDAGWISAMMEKHSVAGNGAGYGYQIWLTSRPGTVKADGAYGQYIFVAPDKDMVIVMTQNHVQKGKTNPSADQWTSVSRLLNKVVSSKPLAKGNDLNLLRKKQGSYHFPYTNGEKSSIKHQTLYRTPVTLQLADNELGWETLKLSQSRSDELKLEITTSARKSYTLMCGSKTWLTRRISGQPMTYNDRSFQGQFSGLSGPFYASASYGWYGASGDDLYVRLHFVNWISGGRLHFHFKGQSITSLSFRQANSTKEVAIPILQSK